MTATPELTGIDAAALTTDLKAQVLTLEDDLRERLAGDTERDQAWRDEHRSALEAGRTAMAWTAFRDDRITQVAVAWVLTTVFIRFCEDNSLVEPVWIAGPTHRRQEALDAQLDYFRRFPEHTDREWLGQAVDHLGSLQATAGLVNDYSPIWQLAPSGNAVTALLAFWRRTDDDEGQLVHDLTSPALSTRFLGDLYQDLSEYARATFALLQTPVFVEEFILDQTLKPALEERPLEGFTLIDPTCGSGHFLLGAFERLLTRWRAEGVDDATAAHRALESIHGVDLNPFAVAIARFRLTVAALHAVGLTSLTGAPEFPLNLAVGDSLLHGGQAQFDLGLDDDAELSGFAYSTEDLEQLRSILTPGAYDVVVGNPPYITVKDKTLNQEYRRRYDACKGKYPLTVPFMERFYELARRGRNDQPAGWTGQITSDSFMKRESGSKLIEEFLPKVDLTHVINSEGAWIPGHNSDGTPTAILIGRNRQPQTDTVRTLLSNGKRETRVTGPDGTGPYWRGIVDHIDEPGYEDDWVTVTDSTRDSLASHPWSLSGGGATDLADLLNAHSERLGQSTFRIGIFGIMGSDDAMVSVEGAGRRRNLEQRGMKNLVLGDTVRDFAITKIQPTWFPYSSEHELQPLDTYPGWTRHFWPIRTELENRATFSGGTYRLDNRPFYEWHQLPKDIGAHSFTLTFSSVASHNHFVLDRVGMAFNRHAPVIKLPEGASEEDHLALIGVLNSSTTCFWLRLNSQPKGGAAEYLWSRTYEFTGTRLKGLPLPATLPLERGRTLDRLAQQTAVQTPAALAEEDTPTASALSGARSAHADLRGRMIAEQEELDWETYRLYGLIDVDLTYTGDDLPTITLGERAFEIVLARKVAAERESDGWFTRHGSTPITEIPAHWPQDYQDLVQRRIDLIESDRFIGLLEQPEHKRRWSMTPWEKQQDEALRDWLLDRLEDRKYWFDRQGRPAPRSIGQLADQVARDQEMVDVIALWEGNRDTPLIDSLTRLMVDEAVPYLAAMRLKDSGMRKRAAWEETWALQRREDAGENVGTIPVPPKYTTADFRKNTWWLARGKLDVPKERFILYPDAGRATDPTALLGWAGWDHAQQSLALATIIGQREAEGWQDEQFVPLVAGLAELQPWVDQWHAETDPAYGTSMAAFTAEQLRERALQVGRTADDLAAWRPPARTRRPKSRTSHSGAR